MERHDRGNGPPAQHPADESTLIVEPGQLIEHGSHVTVPNVGSAVAPIIGGAERIRIRSQAGTVVYAMRVRIGVGKR